MMGVSSCNTMSQEPSAVRGLAFAVMVREVPHREAQRRQALDRGHPARRRVSGGAAGHHLTAGREAVAATVNRECALLRSILRLALAWDEVSKLPVFKMAKEERRERFLSIEEITRQLDACQQSKNTRLRSLVLTALHTGLRKASCCGCGGSRSISPAGSSPWAGRHARWIDREAAGHPGARWRRYHADLRPPGPGSPDRRHGDPGGAWAPRSRRKSAQRQHMALRRRDRRWRGACNCARMHGLKPGTAP